MPCPHYTSRNVFSNRQEIYCTISPPLSGATEDCFIVQVQQLQMGVLDAFRSGLQEGRSLYANSEVAA